MKVHMYGIPDCDTIRKARGWLDDIIEVGFSAQRYAGLFA